jgi:hypothetical protein
VVNPGSDPASCAFPIDVSLVGRPSFQVFFDSQGQPVTLRLHEIWTGTDTANGKTVIEHAAQEQTIDLVSGASTATGQIHGQVPLGGVVIHDVGIVRVDGSGNVTFEAGPHQGSKGDVAGLCAALS